MSGQQIGTVVGGVVGSFIPGVGTYLGMAIGGFIGGAVDPTRINGPHLGDGQQQTATDGSPIAWVLGTALVAGTIVQVSKRREVKVKDSGGKGGPTVSHYEGRQDFAVLVCESCSLRDSTMSSVLMVLQDGVIVYDVRPGSNFLAQSYKWRQGGSGSSIFSDFLLVRGKAGPGVDFMFGDEDQMPHPTMEAITGVGNTPAYRGSLVAVFKNFNTSAAGGRIPTFHFLVAASGSPSLSIPYDDPSWKHQFSDSTTDFSAADFDDSSWPLGRGGFGNGGPAAAGQVVNTPGPIPDAGQTIWLRRLVSATPGVALTVEVAHDNNAKVWWNGELLLDQSDATDVYGSDSVAVDAAKVLALNMLAIRVCEYGHADPANYSYLSASVSQAAVAAGTQTLSNVVSKVCVRGGLSTADIDVSALSGLTVLGYPIARQTTGADALLPLLSAYFAFGSEQDAKLVFDLYGANVSTTIDAADLIEGNDANHNAIKWTKRNQATEYPRRMVAGYMDPAQNYTIVNVAAERRASGVTAIGDQTFAIPAVMAANDAAQAVDKALKVAYATLEGTAEYSVPFAQSACYLSLTAGDPIFFSGKRYVLDDMIVSNGYLKLTTRYDRQSAYTSDVQAIPGNAPSVPPSPYSGPTTLIPMNLPALRPQDSVGIYVAAGSSIGSADWRGCDVQISYDGMETWQAATQINSEANIGQFAAAEPTGGEPLTVDLFAGDLISATTAQLAANANVFAIVGANGTSEIAQFATATESMTTSGEFALTGVSRALAGTPEHAVTTAMRFAQMDAAYFIPIDPAFAGRTLYLRGVGFGEVAEGATIEPVLFTAIIATPGVARIAEDGTARIAEDGINLRFTEK